MRLLQKIILDSIGEYLPGLDKEQLRVDVLNGRCYLEDVDCTPGPILAFAGCPFRLVTGHVGTLELKVPWKSLSKSTVRICAQNVSLCFEEVPFPSRIDEVREAFNTAKRRTKLRSIADGEKRASMISRLLQKLLPLVLHHVEVDLSNISFSVTFVSGYHVCLHIGKIATSENARTQSTSGQQQISSDLSKLLLVEDINIDIFKHLKGSHSRSSDVVHINRLPGFWKKTRIFRIPKFEVCLSFDGGALAVIFEIPCTVAITLHIVLLDLFKSFNLSCRHWETVQNYNTFHSRPRLRPVQDPKSWFQYGAQEVLRNKQGTSVKALHDEYKNLHLRRLTVSHRLQKGEDDRLTELEQSFDVATILSLRDQASKESLVDEAATIATGDLLSRFLFGSQLTDKREAIASEIRQALESLERFSQDFGSSADKLGNLTQLPRRVGGTWTKAIVTARLQRVNVSIAHGNSCLVLSISGAKGWAEVDSSLSNYAGVLVFDDAVISNGTMSLLQRTSSERMEHEVLMQWHPSSCVAPPLDQDALCTLQVRKMRLDHSVTISLLIASLSIEVDLSSFAPLVGFVNHGRNEAFGKHSGRLEISETGNRLLSPPGDGSDSPVKTSLSTIFHVDLAGSTIVVAIPSTNLDDAYSSKKFACLDFQRTIMDVEVQSSLRTAKIRTRLAITGGIFLNPTQSIPASQLSLRIVEDVSIDISYQRRSLLVEIGEVNAFLTNENLEVCTSVVAFLVGQFEGFTEPPGELKHPRENLESKLEEVVHYTDLCPCTLLEISAVHLRLFPQSTPLSSCATFQCVSGTLGKRLARICARDFIFVEENKRAVLQIHPSTASEHGLLLQYENNYDAKSEDRSLSACADSFLLRAGNVCVCSSAVDLSRVMNTVLLYAKQFWYALPHSMGSHVGAATQVVREEQMDFQQKFSIDVKVLSIEISAAHARILIRAEGCTYAFLGGKHSGALQTIEVSDLNNKSGYYSRAVETSQESSNDGAGGCVSYMVENGAAVVQLSHLHVVLLRSFVDKLWSVISDVVDVFLAFFEEVNVVFNCISLGNISLYPSRGPSVSDSDDSGSGVSEEDCVNSEQKTVLHGRSLMVTVPVQKSSYSALRVALPEASVTISEGSQVVSLRKASLLTRPSKPTPKCSVASSSQNPVVQEWIYLVRHLDLDFSHIRKSFCQDGFESIDRSSKSRSHWSFDVLNHASILLVPSQLWLIRNVVSQLFPPEAEMVPTVDNTVDNLSKGDNAHGNGSDEDDSGEDTVPSSRPVCEHLLIEVGTEVLSLELLEEGEHGALAASIANVTCGPCWFSLESIHETTGSSRSTRVTRRNLSMLSVLIEDRRRRVRPGRGLVLAIRPKSDSPHTLWKRSDSDRSSSSVIFESLGRVEDDVEKVSSKLRISEPLFCFCPDLITSVSDFFSHSMARDGMENDGSTASSATIDDECEVKNISSSEPMSCSAEDVGTVAERHQSLVPTVVFKCSIAVLRPTVFVPVQASRKMYGLKLTSSGIKASLLMDKDGHVLQDSSLRSKLFEVVIPRHEAIGVPNRSDIFSAEAQRRFSEEDGSLQVDQRLPVFSAENPAEYTSVFNVGHALYEWAGADCDQALRAAISGVSAKLSTTFDHCWGISVTGVHVDTDFTTLLDWTVLFNGSPPEGESTHVKSQSTPPMDLSIRNISVHVTIRLDDENGEETARMFRVRLRGSWRLRLNRDLSFVSSRARISADVLNENTAIRDQLLAPCDVKVKIDTVASRLSVTFPMSIQITVSPLTVKTVTGIVVLVNRHCLKRTMRSTPEAMSPACVVQESKQSEGIEIFVHIRGIVTALVAEEPRAHLMRFVFRDVRAYIMWVTEELSWGNFELEVGAILLEDVISWHLFGCDESRSDEIEWNTLFSGANNVTGNSSPRQTDLLPVLSDRRRPLLQPGSFEHADLQMTLPFPTEDLSIDESCDQMSSDETASFFCVFAKWQYPAQHVAVQVTIDALDLRLNSTILPSLLEWVSSISSAVGDMLTTHVNSNSLSERNFDAEQYYATAPITIDNFVIEPITVRIATKAPPRPVEQSAFRRLLDWLVGSDFMHGLTLETTRISFGGEFKDLNSLLGTLRVEYINALMSRYMIAQLFMQVPALSTLTRVGASTVLRQRSFSMTEAIMGGPLKAKESTTPACGLATALLEDEESDMVPSRSLAVFTRLQHRLELEGNIVLRSESDLSMEVVDLTSIRKRM